MSSARLISVVEDEETIRELVARALAKAGYRTETFADGALAWDAFARALPDLVILDIGLPRLDGL
jgi:DNA-binding response OmpR family regulator